MEITGVLEEREESAHPGLVGAALGVMELVRQQCAVVHSASNALYRAARQHRPAHAPSAVHLLEFGDGNLVTLAALTQAITPDPSTSMCKVIIFLPDSRNVILDFIQKLYTYFSKLRWMINLICLVLSLCLKIVGDLIRICKL